MVVRSVSDDRASGCLSQMLGSWQGWARASLVSQHSHPHVPPHPGFLPQARLDQAALQSDGASVHCLPLAALGSMWGGEVRRALQAWGPSVAQEVGEPGLIAWPAPLLGSVVGLW